MGGKCACNTDFVDRIDGGSNPSSGEIKKIPISTHIECWKGQAELVLKSRIKYNAVDPPLEGVEIYPKKKEGSLRLRNPSPNRGAVADKERGLKK